MPDINGDRESGAERRLVLRHHRLKMKAARLIGTERGADNARRVADNERHFVGRAMRGRHEEIAFVFAVVVVGDDDDFAVGEGLDRGFDATVAVGHDSTSKKGLLFEWPRRSLADLTAMH